MRAGFVLLFLLATTGCLGDKDALHPGTSIGTFHVEASSTLNTCGDGALGETDDWSFDVKLSRGPHRIYWDSGGAVVTGTVESDDEGFWFDTSVLVDARAAEGDTTSMPCSLLRSDSATGALDSASDDVTSFTAELGYDFDATPGSSCGDLVGVAFEALPCSMKYTLSADRTSK